MRRKYQIIKKIRNIKDSINCPCIYLSQVIIIITSTTNHI